MSPGTDESDFEILEIIDLSDTGPQPAVPAPAPVHAPVSHAVHPPAAAAQPAAAPRRAPVAPAGALLALREAEKTAAVKLLRELLSPLDALESCVREKPDAEQLEQGVRMALRALWNVFRPYELERIEGEGFPFDPRVHEAAEITPSTRVPVNTVLETLRVGYTLGGELVRPALVRVSVEAGAAPGRSE